MEIKVDISVLPGQACPGIQRAEIVIVAKRVEDVLTVFNRAYGELKDGLDSPVRERLDRALVAHSHLCLDTQEERAKLRDALYELIRWER